MAKEPQETTTGYTHMVYTVGMTAGYPFSVTSADHPPDGHLQMMAYLIQPHFCIYEPILLQAVSTECSITQPNANRILELHILKAYVGVDSLVLVNPSDATNPG